MDALAADFLAETRALCDLLAPLPDDAFVSRHLPRPGDTRGPADTASGVPLPLRVTQ